MIDYCSSCGQAAPRNKKFKNKVPKGTEHIYKVWKGSNDVCAGQLCGSCSLKFFKFRKTMISSGWNNVDPDNEIVRNREHMYAFVGTYSFSTVLYDHPK